MKIAYFGLPLGALLLEQDGHDLVIVALSRLDMVGLRRVRNHFAGRLLERPQADDPTLLKQLQTSQADLLVSWFWTTRLPMNLVRACPLGGVGIHPSLLPRHRGPDPYFWAIETGDQETGVTAHRIAADYDTGAILAQRKLLIDPSWNAWNLARALDRPSLALLREVVQSFASGAPLQELEQDETMATEAPQPKDEFAALDFHTSTAHLLRRVRALAPSPGAFFELEDRIFTILKASAASHYPRVLAPGEAAVVEQQALIRTSDGAILLHQVEVDGEVWDTSRIAAFLVSVTAQTEVNGDSVSE